MAVDYPLNVGGRPLHSWPAFVPVTFELTILCAAVTGVIGLLLLCRMPRLFSTVQAGSRFRFASLESYFLLAYPDSEHEQLDEAMY